MAARASDSTQQGIKSVEVSYRVLLALEHGRGPMTLSEVAKGSGLHPAKTHRYLASLIRTGLASQDVNTGLYDLGPAARHLGVEALRRTDAVSLVSAYAVELRDESGHTVNVAVWNDSGPTLVRWDTGAHSLPIVVRVGSTLPLLDSAVGNIFLAYLPRSTTADVLRDQQKQGATRTMPAKEIDALISEIRRDGIARTRNQMIFGLAALAAPVFGAGGDLELVVGLVLPTALMTAAAPRQLGVRLRSTVQRASSELGFTEPVAAS
jgi:DNA-binding IclR family transcriptional regulator